MGREYPTIFGKIKTIKIQSSAEMKAVDSRNGPGTLAYSWTFDDTYPRGIYVNQERFANKAATDSQARVVDKHFKETG